MNMNEHIAYIDKTYVPEKISSGVELYSGNVDAASFRQGFNTAKNMIIAYLKGVDRCDICGAEPMTTNCNNAGCDV